ncbi:MAG: diguanylate cyclase/phosphodiesterase with sensor(s) [Frankiales bacterium]|nr:diguanylate cyclase/phosphodiesterase with sensor(s) [Frankiales bacterium]
MSGPKATSWSTQQLTEMLALVAAVPAGADVVQRAVEHMVESLEADVGAAASADQVLASVGYSADSVPSQELLAASHGELKTLHVPGAGQCSVVVVAFEGIPGGNLLLGRRLPDEFDSEERSLFRGFARVLTLALQARSALHDERTRRAASEADALHRQGLLDSLGERQALLERLSRIQRSISTRRPLNEVLHTIVEGASELIGDEIAGLRLVDPDDPEMLMLAACIGLSPEMRERTRRSRVGEGIGGLAISKGALIVTEDYGSGELPLEAFTSDGVRSSMAAPVYHGSEVVGSLVLATRRSGRSYSDTEREMLLAFAEHTGLALNDARTVAALHQAVGDATRQARQDPLTGLPNRTDFLEKLKAARASARQVSLLFIDLDDFKLVNDTLGHPVGDALLCLVGDRIVGSVRGDDLVARLGGDEFAVLLTSTPPHEAEGAAERIRQALSQPFRVPGHHVSIGASTGVVLCSGDLDNSPEELLRDADVAMYRAKALGKGRSIVFTPSMRIDLQARSRLERDLRSAIEEQELVVHYQPVVDAVLGRVVGSEALVRWEHPELGLVPPQEFIPVAETTGMIVPIGRQVLMDATRQTALWTGLTVSVNVSARQLGDGLVVEHVREALSRSGLPPDHLTLELTESVLVDDIDIAAGILTELKQLGVRIAIDDFGTGYSSLSYLAQLPVDVLKVDKQFVSGVERGGTEARLAGAVVAIAHSLQLTTVTEGIETTAQLAAMQRLGCTHFQGYLWSPPVPASDFLAATSVISAQTMPRPRGAGPLRVVHGGRPVT